MTKITLTDSETLKSAIRAVPGHFYLGNSIDPFLEESAGKSLSLAEIVHGLQVAIDAFPAKKDSLFSKTLEANVPEYLNKIIPDKAAAAEAKVLWEDVKTA